MATLQVSVSLLRRVAPILGGAGGEMSTVPRGSSKERYVLGGQQDRGFVLPLWLCPQG